MKMPKVSRAEADRISAEIRKINADLRATCNNARPAIDATIRRMNADLLAACRACRPMIDALARATKPPRG